MLCLLLVSFMLFPNSAHAASPSVASRVEKLDKLITLTADQKQKAAEIFRVENETLDALSAEVRAEQGMEARAKSRAEIRALLTPQQRTIYDIAPQTSGGGVMFSPENLVARIDQVVTLTEDQKRQATEIIWNEFLDQLAAAPPENPPKGFLWRPATRDLLRALFTPEQREKYDHTPVAQGGGQAGPGMPPR